MEYDARLKELDLTSLEDRRTRGDMIYTYRLINGWEGVDYGKFFSLEDHHYNLWGHSKKIARTNMNLDVRKKFFSRKVIEKWNSLTEGEVSATSISSFKAKYDKLEKNGR